MFNKSGLTPLQWRKKKNYIIPASEYKKIILNVSSEKNKSFNTDITKTSVEYKTENKSEKYQENVSSLDIEKSDESSKDISKEEPSRIHLKYKKLNQNKPVSGFSLSSVALKKAANKINKPQVSEEKLPKDSFHQKDLEFFWKKYTKEQKDKGKNNVASILSLNNVILDKSNIINFSVANEMNKVELHSEMENLLPYLKKKLNNFSLKIEINITEVIKEEIAFSPQEKYQYLLKANNVLDELRKKFDLDF